MSRSKTITTPASNRTDILSLSEEVKLIQTTHHTTKYSATLPFNPSEVPSWRAVAKVLEKTKKGWAWFAAARTINSDNDTNLGTLSYLPRETRDMIYERVLEDYINLHWHDTVTSTGGIDDRTAVTRKQLRYPHEWSWTGCWECERAAVLDNVSEHKNCSRPMIPSFAVRAAGTASHEFEEMLLSQTVFCFGSPEAFGVFLSWMALTQHSYLRQVTIELLALDYNQYCEQFKDWTHRPRDYHCVWKAWMRNLHPHGEALKSLKVVRFSFVGSCTIRRKCAGPEPIGNIQQLVDILEVVTKALRRFAPRVKFVLDEDDVFLDEDRWSIGKVLSEVD